MKKTSKKLNKKRALRILKRQYGRTTFSDYVMPLCLSFTGIKNKIILKRWRAYWSVINTDRFAVMEGYMNISRHRYKKGSTEYYEVCNMMSLLRFLSLHIFINDTYK